MHDDRGLIEARVGRARERIAAEVARASVPCSVGAIAPGEGLRFAEALARRDRASAVAAGDWWGAPWTTTWFSVSGRLPSSWPERHVELEVDLGFDARQPGFQAEGLAYDLAGKPLKGIHPRNASLPARSLGPASSGPGNAGILACLVEAVAMPGVMGGGADTFAPTPLGARASAGAAPLYRFGGARLVLVDEEVRALGYDVEVLCGLAAELARDSGRRRGILRSLERAVDVLDRAGIAPGAAAARAELAGCLASTAENSAHRVVAVGHAHIDSAWLWPVAETVRKCARTFSSVLALLDEEADADTAGEEVADRGEVAASGSASAFVFACSQAQQWDWMRVQYPQLFAKMVARARSGRFVPVGGMWVESDTNVPGGESLVRQLVYGKRFFSEHTGIECEEVWLPDCFGYSAALPQLIALAGSRFFLTQKLSWNDTNRFPHHSFWWEGLDGTRVFTHFPPVDTYNSELSPAELARARRNFAEAGRATTSLVPFGYGDGGGGPTAAMLERGRRQHDLEGSPRVAFGSPTAFFRAAAQEYPEAPVWSGELYLEKHRGTLTSQARIKALNRRCEHLLREAELWCTTAWSAGLAEYPFAQLERIWKSVLLQQFHDILPGSSIADTNDDALGALGAAAAELGQLLDSTTSLLAGPGAETVAFNGSPFARLGVAALSSGWQVPRAGPASTCTRAGDGVLQLDNGLLCVRVGDDGLLESLVDLGTGRELVAPGARANLLQLHPDHPAQWDAWDVEAWYRNSREDLVGLDELSVESAGPDEAVVSLQRSFGASRVTQRLRLRRGERRLRIETDLDWHEHERLLKLAFPLDLHACSSRSEIQFGHLEDPLAANTSWDTARFELRCHRFVHLAEAGEPGYGVAVVNDATYGHDVSRRPRPGGGLTTTLRLSLVRGPRFPDPRADAGMHRFVVEIHPGATLAHAVQAGYDCNLPMRLVPGGGLVPPLVALEPDAEPADHGSIAATLSGSGSSEVPPGIVVETVKAADDRSGDVVVRLYEALGGRAQARLRPSFALASTQVVDLLERPLGEAAIDAAGRVRLDLRPFEVLTLRLHPQRRFAR